MVRLRHQSLSQHVRSESQREATYDVPPPTTPAKDVAMSTSASRGRSWRFYGLLLLGLAGLNLLVANGVRQVFSSSKLHLIIPVTNANQYLCQLLLSSVILNYPTPILLTWDSPERGDSAKRFSTKVGAIKKYLDNFKSKDESDLVLIVDGFHSWFQLPPDVVLRRYFAAIEADNKRVKAQYGAATARRYGMYQTILFSADKSCGPHDDNDWVGCWAPPQSPLPMYTFGPYNDTLFEDVKTNPYHARPRWLNSGMMIGPAKDLKALFGATAELMQSQKEVGSDWWYYANLFGMQEYGRSLRGPRDSLVPENLKPPEIKAGQNVEFHIGLDYENKIFQTLGYNDQYLTWYQFDKSMDPGVPSTAPNYNLYHYKLAKDVSQARRPFEAMHDLKMSAYNEKYQELLQSTKRRPDYRMWHHLPLFTNVVTRHVFPMLHFTFEEDYRDIWWEKMWFYPFARDLMVSSAGVSAKPLTKKRINGRKWYNSQTPESPYLQGSNQERRDGAWNEKGEWKSFSGMCSDFEKRLFGESLESSVLNPS